jgi:hypothetical protein
MIAGTGTLWRLDSAYTVSPDFTITDDAPTKALRELSDCTRLIVPDGDTVLRGVLMSTGARDVPIWTLPHAVSASPSVAKANVCPTQRNTRIRPDPRR